MISVEGVPKRSAFHAWLPAAIQCESTRKLAGIIRPVIQGVAIHTEKFFDNVPQAKALAAFRALGLASKHVATWAYGLANINRHVSLNWAVEKQPFHVINGVPQGDPMSLIAAAALLGQWTLEILDSSVFNRFFVDDRLMLADDNEAIHEAFLTTQLWHFQMDFVTDKKAYASGNNHE